MRFDQGMASGKQDFGENVNLITYVQGSFRCRHVSLRKTFQATRPSIIIARFVLAYLLCVLTAGVYQTSAIASNISPEGLKPIAKLVKEEIRSGHIPGAVVIIGNEKRTIYRRAFGYRSVKPKRLPMTEDTIFDMASVTKVVATTTAVMQLVENGKLELNDPVSKYWPEFRSNGKEVITVKELLTHYSGMRPDLDEAPGWSGYETAMEKIADEKTICQPAVRFIYSDINFEILGELVRRVSGQPLDDYCSEHIFRPLGMDNTFFGPLRDRDKRIAPTQFRNGKKGQVLCGEVHDPTAMRMGGVAGHAGLFATADDLAVFARMLLNGGTYKGTRILSAASIEEMTLPQSPPDKTPRRGLGWNIDAPFASNRDELFPAGSYSHKGFTGTMIWIDPISKTYVILLTNRVHPSGKGDAEPLRRRILSLVSLSLGPISQEKVLARRPLLASYSVAGNFTVKSEGKVQAGIDVLKSEKFSSVEGLRLGLITNHSGMDSTGRRTIDIMSEAANVRLVALFSPEHGLYGTSDEKVPSADDPLTGLRVYSLYGDTLRPTEKMLEGIDALVFDIQDAGVRFYTYITTMAYVMEAAARKGIPFYVLDRPNPLTGSVVQGPVMDNDMKSFTGYFPLPIRHGMTVGELARMFNSENKIGVDLHIVKMHGYNRDYWYDNTGLPWVAPSPNLRSLTETVLYPGIAMAEGANVSVGRGTDAPFELLGAPWIRSQKLASYLNGRGIIGVRFKPVDFTPTDSIFKNKKCHGVRVILEDRQTLDPTVLGIEIISALYKLYPKEFQIDKTRGLIGSHQVFQSLKDGQDPRAVRVKWKDDLTDFQKLRAGYLMY